MYNTMYNTMHNTMYNTHIMYKQCITQVNLLLYMFIFFFQFIICSEDAEKYRTQTLVEARPTCRAIINSMCKHIVSDSSNRISMERWAELQTII